MLSLVSAQNAPQATSDVNAVFFAEQNVRGMREFAVPAGMQRNERWGLRGMRVMPFGLLQRRYCDAVKRILGFEFESTYYARVMVWCRVFPRAFGSAATKEHACQGVCT
jgi:hypothetical protein